MEDCWQLPPVALRTAVELRTPVVLLTSKEMVMTERSFDLAQLAEIKPLPGHAAHPADESYRPYAAEADQAPPFLPVGNGQHQVRLTASTHDTQGLLRHSTDEALANTRRLWAKVEANTPVLYDLDEQEEAQTLVMTYGITAGAAREAVDALRREGQAVSLLIARTLLPLPEVYYEILDRYRIVVAEENLKGQLAALLYGRRLPEHVRVVSRIGHMVEPEEIIQAVREVRQ
jgi:2-oxoglutarate ferredoxin oxidoreductase subunit alpha